MGGWNEQMGGRLSPMTMPLGLGHDSILLGKAGHLGSDRSIAAQGYDALTDKGGSSLHWGAVSGKRSGALSRVAWVKRSATHGTV